MSSPVLKISNWKPTWHPKVEPSPVDGSYTVTREEKYVVVKIFCYSGVEHSGPFMTLETYFCGRRYLCRLPKAYHPRWFGRLAAEFDREVMWNAKKRRAI